jgi:hypothetical protein
LSLWAGIDGFGSPTVEQAGINIISTSNCTVADQVVAFVEAFPSPEVIIDNFTIKPGDVLSIQVWIDAQHTCGAWLNETRQEYTSACLTDPGPVAAITYEWIIERPLVNGAVPPLANYGAAALWETYAQDWSTQAVWGTAVWPPTNFNLVMVDDTGTAVSTPYPRLYDTLLFSTAGQRTARPAAIACRDEKGIDHRLS